MLIHSSFDDDDDEDINTFSTDEENLIQSNEIAEEINKAKNIIPNTIEEKTDDISPALKIEKLRDECEKEYGNEMFLKVYRLIKDKDSDNLPPVNQKFINKVISIIHYEDMIY